MKIVIEYPITTFHRKEIEVNKDQATCLMEKATPIQKATFITAQVDYPDGFGLPGLKELAAMIENRSLHFGLVDDPQKSNQS